MTSGMKADFANCRNENSNKIIRIVREIVLVVGGRMMPRWCLNWSLRALLRSFSTKIGIGTWMIMFLELKIDESVLINKDSLCCTHKSRRWVLK